jgi:hypothetical protein
MRFKKVIKCTVEQIVYVTLISGFRRDVDEICGLLGYYTASCAFLLGILTREDGTIRCPETSVNKYHTTPCNNPEDHRFNICEIRILLRSQLVVDLIL